MKLSIIEELLKRISSSSPTLFKRLQALFFTLAGIILVLILLEPLKLNLHGFEGYVNWNTFLVLLGFAGVNMLPVSDPNILKKESTTEPEEDGAGGRPVDRNKP